ncbi:hypothetical protein G3580_17665 [Nitrogeniibacter mangrovi]|uniref:Uncharacterized protein n=1 Tax=Nitrogeniibacter mangrovi TaxID=2016596 RepID=A0A6C1AXQ8_9RHOO|nr:hypothetical protein [Nitrogeniibacter mangrovi]QID16141.1 hypothetical protein G3580_17665 [Nitrogeniibacter mangrovi]
MLLLLGGCASMQQAVDRMRGEAAAPPPAAEVPAAETDTATPAPEPVKPARATPRVAPRPPEAPAPKPAPEPVPVPAPASVTKTPLPGPAWLGKCRSAQAAGGVVRCDTDLLLAKPSPTVQVFTRDPARVVPGQILLRRGLPNVYRMYVVP